MRTHAAPLLLLILLAVIIPLHTAGCATARTDLPRPPEGEVSMEMLVKGEQGKAALYRVKPERTLGFGGGRDASAGRVTWTGPINDDKYDALLALLDEHGWLAGERTSTAIPDDDREINYTVHLRTRNRSLRYHADGPAEDMQTVERFLRDLSMARHQRALDQLPQPGDRRR